MEEIQYEYYEMLYEIKQAMGRNEITIEEIREYLGDTVAREVKQ